MAPSGRTKLSPLIFRALQTKFSNEVASEVEKLLVDPCEDWDDFSWYVPDTLYWTEPLDLAIVFSNTAYEDVPYGRKTIGSAPLLPTIRTHFKNISLGASIECGLWV